MSILILTIIAALSLGLFRIFEKLIGTSMHPLFAAIIIYAAALVFILSAFFYFKPKIVIDGSVKKGVGIAFLAGATIAMFDILALTIFSRGSNVSIFTPLVNGGSILIVALVGFLFLRESINPTQFLGILAIVSGIFLLTK
jgi:uncharacterized membrane protein